jgi:superfamily II DNA/RNA helicase
LKFSELSLHTSLQSAIDQQGFAEATPIQELTIPLAIEGKDVSGLAQTGTGKTAAFLIPLMERILRARDQVPEAATDEQKTLIEKRAFADWRAQNFILVLVPTRELAEQVFENIKSLSTHSGLRGVSVYGGTGYDKQKEAFAAGVEFVVATPGRLIDLYKEHHVDLKQVRAIVFDEADRMFDMGFKDDMKYILQRVPKDRQFLVFSATLNFDVLNTAYQFGAEPIEVNISRDQAKAENVVDEIFHVGHDDKPAYLLSLIKKYSPRQVIVFSNFKNSVEVIAGFLTNNGYPAMAISSLLTQAQRNKVLEQFKSENEKNILVATDVAARGLDIKGVDMVVNIEMPNDAESYVHRIGRTGRAGAEGRALSLVSDQDVESLARVEAYLKNKLTVAWLDEAELIKDFKPVPHERSYDRGPRHESREARNDRPARGPRRDSAAVPTGPRRDGGRPGPRPPRAEGRPEKRRHDGKPAGHGGSDQQGPRRNQAPGARPAHSANGAAHESRGPSKNQGRPQHPQRHQGKKSGASSQRPSAARAAGHHKKQETGVLQKVSGFFKKIFGGDSGAPKKNS